MPLYFLSRFQPKIFLFLLLLSTVSAVVRAGNSCATADAITPGGACSTTQVNGNAGTLVIAGCSGTIAREEWWSFTAVAGVQYSIVYQSSSNENPAIVLYSQSTGCGSLAEVSCTNSTGNGNPVVEQLNYTAVSSGLYYIRIVNYNTGTMDGRLCVAQTAANDEPTTASALSVGTACSYTSFTTIGATASSCGTIPNPGCASYVGGDVWFSLVVPASGVLYLEADNNGGFTDGGMALYSGSACGVMTLIDCDDDGGPGNMPEINASGLTPGSTVYLRFWEYGNNASGTFDLCAYTSPDNDNPDNATPLPVGAGCTFSSFSNLNATASTCGTIPAPGCGGYGGSDVWFSILVPASGSLIIESQTNGGMTDGAMALYSGTACGALTLIECDDNDGPGNMPELTINGLTPGTTVYLRFWEDGNNNNGSFNVCVSDPCPGGGPVNNDCSTASVLPVYTSACTGTLGTVACAGPSADANSCGATADDDDVWYRFTASATSVNISITSVSGSTTDLYHSLYTGTCGSLGNALLCSDPNSSTPTGLTIGQNYYIRVYTATATGGQSTTFQICVTEMSPCGNPTNNDFCSDPAILNFDASSTFSSTTSNSYTADTPGNLNAEFCGTIQNNSWYSFVATAASHSFNFSSVSGCAGGIQAEVYAITYNATGCCTNFNSVSNCFSPGSSATGTVTATGLTVGNTYVLMVDGWAGANCNYTVSGWSATGVLPIELILFEGKNIGNGNFLNWKTASESNNDFFLIERSYNGYDFGVIAQVDGAGNAVVPNDYSYHDFNAEKKLTYYRIRQVDFDGTFTTSHTIAVHYKDNSSVLVYPNPVSEKLNVDLYTETGGYHSIRIVDLLGRVYEEIRWMNPGMNQFSVTAFSEFEKGIYMMQVINPFDKSIYSETIVKQ